MRQERSDKGIPTGWKCGHERTWFNTYGREGGKQRCRQCVLARQKRYGAAYREKHREELNAEKKLMYGLGAWR